MPEPVLTIRLRGTSSFGDRIELTDEEIGLLRRKLEIEFDPTDLQKALDAFRLRSNLMVYIRLNELVSTLKKIARNPKSYNRHVHSYQNRVHKKILDATNDYQLQMAIDETKWLQRFLNKYVLDVVERHADQDSSDCCKDLVEGAKFGLAELERLSWKGDKRVHAPRGRKTNNPYDHLVLDLLYWCNEIGAKAVVSYDPYNEDWCKPFVLFVDELTQIIRSCGYTQLPLDATSTVRRVYKTFKEPDPSDIT